MTTSHFCSHCGADNTPNNAFCSACQQPLDAIQEITILLNERYAILAEVGAGGFGAVYQARDTQEQDRLVAVKQINLKGLSPQEIIEATDAFNREAQLLSTLKHPLLPRIFDRFSDAEHWYLVMTFIDGSTLDEYVQQHASRTLPTRAGLSLDETLRIGLQLCEVLKYLHTQHPPVIFRDIKPGNIMRTSSGRLYLIDFGIARHFKPGQTKDTIPFGSPGFAAPEQYGRAQTTPQADIYSLGALLSCLISGDDPADHPFQFPPLHLYGIDGINELDALIQRMVALAPEQRPATIVDVRDELLAIQHIHAQANKHYIWTPTQGQTPDASALSQQHIFSSVSPANTAARKTTRRRVVTAGLAVGGAVLVGGIVVALGGHQSAIPATPLVGQSQADSTTATTTVQDTNPNAAVPLNGPTYWSPDLSHAAVANTSTGQLELYMVQNQQMLHVLESYRLNAAEGVKWSPDNKKILLPDFVRDEVLDVNSGESLFKLPSDTVVAAWSPNGNYLAINYFSDMGTNAFALLNSTNGTTLFQQDSLGVANGNLSWSSDNRYIAIPDVDYSQPNQNGVWVLEIWDSQKYEIVRTLRDQNNSDLALLSQSSPIVSWSPSNHQIALIYENAIWLCDLNNTNFIHHFASITDNVLNSSLVWSPNDKYLAILLDQNLAIWDIASRRSIQLKGNSSPSNIAAIAWSADSQSITAADSNNVISHWTIG